MESKTITLSLDDIMGDRFSRYSKYIIQDRALPDVRDGLKPVQRRILYAMYKEGNLPGRPYRKSAKTVGVVIGNYHPHGDSSVYEAMVRLSQDWKMRAPLVDMQGNNGSIDNDPAAAMRYTEARLSPIAIELLKDIDKDTVAMALNFDDTEYEPTVLPALYPNLLVNGATGISAGYATDIPPHNLEEVIDATIYRIQHPHCSFKKLTHYIKGPDFPTGAIVEGKEAIIQALKTGRGKVIVRSKCEIVEGKSINQIVVDEIPYEVNKAELVRKIDEIRNNHDIDGIIEVRDESDRQGLRIAIDLKKDVDVVNILNYFYRNTDLQKNYNYNMVAIKEKRPELMGIEGIIDGYIDHEIDVVTRRSLFDLDKAKKRAHIVEGLILAISVLDEVVAIIRASRDKSDAKNNLVKRFHFTLEQAEAIVMLQLYRLTNTDIVALQAEKKRLDEEINRLNAILDSDEVLRSVIIDQLRAIKKAYPTPRLTSIVDEVLDTSIDTQAMIIAEETIVTITRDGYIKRVSKRSYKASQFSDFMLKDQDFLVSLYEANTLDTLLAFTNLGNYCFIPVYKLEEFKWKELGKHINNFIKVDKDERIIDTILVRNFDEPVSVVLATRLGQVKRVALKEFEVVRHSRALKCMSLKKDDELAAVDLARDHMGVLLGSQRGYTALFSLENISLQGIKAGGIKGINLTQDDRLAFIRVFDPNLLQSLVILVNPSGVKRIKINEIPACNRATKGTLIYQTPKTKNHRVINGYVMQPNDELTVFGEDEHVELVVKDLNYGALKARPSTIKQFSPVQIDHIYNHQHLRVNPLSDTSSSDQTKDETKPEVIPSETIQPQRSAEKKEKEKPVKRFEPISFEDLFKDDF